MDISASCCNSLPVCAVYIVRVLYVIHVQSTVAVFLLHLFRSVTTFDDEGKPVETMATHGTMKTFNPQVDDWPTYIERLQHYFVANDVEDADKKRAILLTVCGVPTYKLLRSLVPDGKLDGDDATYNSLVKLLKDHYNPTPSPIVQRFHFIAAREVRTNRSPRTLLPFGSSLFTVSSETDYRRCFVTASCVGSTTRAFSESCWLRQV